MTMSYEERGDLMRKGACFRCKRIGHLSRDCPQKTHVNSAVTKTPPKRYATRKEAYAHIRTLMAELDEEAKEEVLKLGEEEGF